MLVRNHCNLNHLAQHVQSCWKVYIYKILRIYGGKSSSEAKIYISSSLAPERTTLRLGVLGIQTRVIEQMGGIQACLLAGQCLGGPRGHRVVGKVA